MGKVILLIILILDGSSTTVERQTMLDMTMCEEEKRNVQDQWPNSVVVCGYETEDSIEQGNPADEN